MAAKQNEKGVNMMQASITGNSEAVLLSCSDEDTIIASSETMPASKALAILAVALNVDAVELYGEILEAHEMASD